MPASAQKGRLVLLGFVVGLLIVILALPFAVGAVRWAKRRRGGAALFIGVLLVFGLDMQITPPPPAAIELIVKQAKDDEPKED